MYSSGFKADGHSFRANVNQGYSESNDIHCHDNEEYAMIVWIKANEVINFDGCAECMFCNKRIPRFNKVIPYTVPGCICPSGVVDVSHDHCINYLKNNYLLDDMRRKEKTNAF